MEPVSPDWGTHQLSEFLAAVSSFPDERSARAGALERAAEALEAELAVIVANHRPVSAIGAGIDHPDVFAVIQSDRGRERFVTTDLLGECALAGADMEDGNGSRLLLARSQGTPFDRQEQVLISNMGRTLGLVLKMLRVLEAERTIATELRERQNLLERMARIQRSISHRAPLQEVLDSITAGLQELTGDELIGLRLVDPEDPRVLVVVSMNGVPERIRSQITRIPAGRGVGGLAFTKEELVVIDDYAGDDRSLQAFADDGLTAAMAAPVYENGRVAGSLVTATYRPDRTYSESEQDVLLAMAEFASIALTDSKTLEAMREAQRAKDLFLAMVSHELKTPLTVIMGALHTVAQRGADLDPALTQELLRTGLERGQDLQKMIDTLLKGTKAELAGERRHVRLPQMIARALRGFEAIRPVALAELPDVPLLVDDSAIQQIAGVLIENAIAHSPLGTEIGVSATVDGGAATISVSNRGELPESGLDGLFEPFRRGDGATSSGVGLGLYIAGRLARSIGGQLSAVSGDGLVRFSLTFPVGVEPGVRLDASRC